jgi:hypothetical protein
MMAASYRSGILLSAPQVVGREGHHAWACAQGLLLASGASGIDSQSSPATLFTMALVLLVLAAGSYAAAAVVAVTSFIADSVVAVAVAASPSAIVVDTVAAASHLLAATAVADGMEHRT